jgi:hypothetical protein
MGRSRRASDGVRMSVLHASRRSPAETPPSDFLTAAEELLDAARRLNDAASSSAGPGADARRAMSLIARALGELGAASSTMRRQLATGTPSSMLDLRTHELISALSLARRDAELVCRHLPRNRLTESPDR